MPGDFYVEQHSIQTIDFLKMDVEGMEREVLNGFLKTISRGSIHVIQFEYGMVNVLSKFLLFDFYEFFKRFGYKVGKIYPNYVDFREYKFMHEDFIGPNYLAVKESRTDIMDKLRS